MNMLSLRNDNLDEIVFEHRNKLYGAYNLRRSYDSHLLKAFVISISSFLFLYFSLCLKDLIIPAPYHIPVDDPVVLTAAPDLVLVIELPAPTAIPVARLESTHNNNGNYAITNKPVPNNLPVTRTVTPPITINATAGMEGSGGNDNKSLGHATLTTMPLLPSVTENTNALTYVDTMPEFPGGESRLKNYLESNLQFPKMAYSVGKEGKVMVSFVIDKDGGVSKINIEKSLGFGCDEEAVRVVENMPKWKPAKRKGQTVAVKLLLPVSFVLQ